MRLINETMVAQVRFPTEEEARNAMKNGIVMFRELGMDYTVRVEHVKDMTNDFWILRLYRK